MIAKTKTSDFKKRGCAHPPRLPLNPPLGMFIMNFLSRSQEKGGDVIFGFQEKVLLDVFCYYEYSFCLWNLNTMSDSLIIRPANTIRDCLQISLLLLCELKTINIKHNRSEIWRRSSRLKEEHLCRFFYVFR